MNTETTKESPQFIQRDATRPNTVPLRAATSGGYVSVERDRFELQARTVAGSLVLAGVALGLLVHPYWFGLSALVGVGLIFAGITDTCPMPAMLPKIPGNQCCAAGRRKT